MIENVPKESDTQPPAQAACPADSSRTGESDYSARIPSTAELPGLSHEHSLPKRETDPKSSVPPWL